MGSEGRQNPPGLVLQEGTEFQPVPPVLAPPGLLMAWVGADLCE